MQLLGDDKDLKWTVRHHFGSFIRYFYVLCQCANASVVHSTRNEMCTFNQKSDNRTVFSAFFFTQNIFYLIHKFKCIFFFVYLMTISSNLAFWFLIENTVHWNKNVTPTGTKKIIWKNRELPFSGVCFASIEWFFGQAYGRLDWDRQMKHILPVSTEQLN